MLRSHFRLIGSLAFGLLIIFIAKYRAIFFESGFPVHYTEPISEEIYKDIHFRNADEEFHLDYNGKKNKDPKMQSSQFGRIYGPPTVSVIDLNGDGYMDLVFSGGIKPVVYLNDQGKKFIRQEAGSFGFDVAGPSSAAMVAFADLNGDGIVDAVVAGHPDNILYYGSKDRKGRLFFKRTPLLDFFKSNAEAVNFLDFKQNGRLDIIFGSFTSLPSENNPSVPLWIINTLDNKSGGGQALLLQDEDGRFHKEDVGIKNRTYTHSIGVADFNRDGYPDIFIGNDYGDDELYFNNKGQNFERMTDEYIPRQYHGHAGMNAEITDYNNSGRLSIFVTNIYKPPFENRLNVLWEEQADGRFKSMASDRGVARCGFAWGSKFADFDNDGEMDLAVTSGRERGKGIKNPGDGESLWYRRSVAARMPRFLRSYYYQYQLPHKGFYVSAFETHCLFRQKNGHFYDIAPYVGIDDSYEGKGLALIDVDNDGRMDFVTTTTNGPAILYYNESKTHGNWLGVNLVDAKGSPMPIGAKTYLTTRKGVKMYREYYPANGYSAQSDPRLHFGFGDDGAESLRVVWPDHKDETFSINELNKYIEIREGHH